MERPYKILVSCTAGLIGFLLNRFPLNTHFEHYTLFLFIGFAAAMLISIVWGAGYGLIAAVISAFPISLIGDNNHVLSFYFLAVGYIAWILWHGWCAKLRKSSSKKCLSKYIAEIPFRASYIAVVFSIFRYLPEYASLIMDTHAASQPHLSYLGYITIESIMNAYLILLIADAAMNLQSVRKIMGLDMRPLQISAKYVLVSSIFFGLLFWIIDSVWRYLLFNERVRSLLFQAPISLADSLFLRVPPDDLIVRVSFMAILLTNGILAANFFQRYHEMEAKGKPVTMVSNNDEISKGACVVDSHGQIICADDHGLPKYRKETAEDKNIDGPFDNDQPLPTTTLDDIDMIEKSSSIINVLTEPKPGTRNKKVKPVAQPEKGLHNNSKGKKTPKNMKKK